MTEEVRQALRICPLGRRQAIDRLPDAGAMEELRLRCGQPPACRIASTRRRPSPLDAMRPAFCMRSRMLIAPSVRSAAVISVVGMFSEFAPLQNSARAASCAASNAALHSDNLTFSALICSSFAESCASLRSNSFCNIEISTVSEVS